MAASDVSTPKVEDGANEEEGREAKAASLVAQKAASSYWAGVDFWRGYLVVATRYAALLHIDSLTNSTHEQKERGRRNRNV